MSVILSTAARKQLRALPQADATRLLDALELIAADLTRRQSFVTEMLGQPGIGRVRKGDWRALYCVVEGDVLVTKIAHRGEAYE